MSAKERQLLALCEEMVQWAERLWLSGKEARDFNRYRLRLDRLTKKARKK